MVRKPLVYRLVVCFLGGLLAFPSFAETEFSYSVSVGSTMSVLATGKDRVGA